MPLLARPVSRCQTAYVYFLSSSLPARTPSRCRRAYILPLWFFFLSFLFFRRLISAVTERISTKLGHIFTYDCYLKIWSELRWAFTTHGLGCKSLFMGPTLFFDWTYLCKGTRYQQSERNLSIYRDSPTRLPFGEFWSRNGWKRLTSFCPPPKFSHWETLQAYRMDVI